MNTNKKRLAIWISVAAVLLAVVVVLGIMLLAGPGKVSQDISVKEAQQYVDKTFSALSPATATGTKAVLENMQITVKSVEYGKEKDVLLNCSYTAKDLSTVTSKAKELLETAYDHFEIQIKDPAKKVSATDIGIYMRDDILELVKQAEMTSGETTLYLYETEKGRFDLYLDDKTVDTCTGGLLTFQKTVNGITEIEHKGETVNIANNGTLRGGIVAKLALTNYDSQKPDTGSALQKQWNSFKDQFTRNFITKARWQYLWNGLMTTLAITALAALLGVFIGFIVAIIRCTCQTTGKLKIADKICALYLTLVRGTPVMVQLLIIYFVILLPAGVDKFPAAVLCFGLNSGAYVAEIVRGGIMSVDRGQNEAGRSLGFGFAPTMVHIIIPQAFKAVLPALANEFITLLKESSVAFYIGVADLTQGGLKIRSLTYSNFMPLIAVAVIYLIIVLILTRLVGLLERRLRKSDH